MSVSFKTVAKLETPAGNLRLGQEVREDGSVTNYYKFIGERALTLEDVVNLHAELGLPVTNGVNHVESKRSGYKFKTTWAV